MQLGYKYGSDPGQDIAFIHALFIYKDVICTGIPNMNVNIYALDALNQSKDITFTIEFHIDDPMVSVSRLGHSGDIVDLIESAFPEFEKDIKASQSDNPLISNAPELRYMQNQVCFREIMYEPVEKLRGYKQPNHIPLVGKIIGYHKLPFVSDNEVRITKIDGSDHQYKTYLLSNKKSELDLMRLRLETILNAEPEHLARAFFSDIS